MLKNEDFYKFPNFVTEIKQGNIGILYGYAAWAVSFIGISYIYMDFILWPFYNCIAWKAWFREHHLSVVFIEEGQHRADSGLLMPATEIQLPCFLSKPSAAWGTCSS